MRRSHLLALGLLLLLAGCVVGPGVVGYRRGSEKNPPVVLATRAPAPGAETEQLLVQETELKYDVPIGPEGAKWNTTMASRFAYFSQRGTAPPQAINLPLKDTEKIEHAVPLPGTDEWFGFGETAESQEEGTIDDVPINPALGRHQFHERSYFILIFSANKVRVRAVVSALPSRHELEFVPTLGAVRFYTNSGWKLWRLSDRQIVVDGSRPREDLASANFIPIPSWDCRLVVNTPRTTETEFFSGGYIYRGTGKGFDLYLEAKASSPSNRRSGGSYKNPPKITQLHGFTRTEWDGEASHFDTTPTTTTPMRFVEYTMDRDGLDIFITLSLTPPYAQTEAMLRNFDESLRLEKR